MERGIAVRYVSVEDAIGELRQSVKRMERIYEMPSEDMVKAIASGECAETAEIALWMIRYWDFKSLTEQPTHPLM